MHSSDVTTTTLTSELATSPSGKRTREDIRRERAALIQETNREIDRLAAEFHAALPRDQARGIGAAYARYSSRFQHSIVDQLRGLFEAALKEKIFIPREAVCFDTAVPGYKNKRPGLDRLRDLLATGDINVFLVFTTNRLFRKTYKALQFVEEEVVEQGIRCIFVKSGVDSADEKRWKMLLQIHAMTDEFVVGMYSENVRSAQGGLFEAGLVFGALPFGFQGRPVEGPLTKRGRPRCELEIDGKSSVWVEQVFRWFVDEHLPISEIARRLNDDSRVPASPRSLTGRWSHKSIRYLLANSRYRGFWQYGVNEAIWQGKKDYSRQMPRPEALRSAQWEHLRIVSDEIWFAAQARLEQQPRPTGRKPVDGDRRTRPLLLNGLFYCPEHQRSLYVGGAHGQYMFCPHCQSCTQAKRPLFTQLNRALALKRTCRKLADLVRSDDSLAIAVVAACREAAARAQKPDPSQLNELRRDQQRLNSQIKFQIDNPGETAVDQTESANKLRELRRARATISAELARREADRDRSVALPTEQEVRSMIDELGAILVATAGGVNADDARDAREILLLLTGGRIELEQCGERRSHGGWLQGRFRVRLLPFLAARSASLILDASEDLGTEVIIDYREPTEPELWADRVKEACDQDKLMKVVATELGISRALATKALASWYTQRDLEVPDGRSRRKSLSQKSFEPALYMRLSEEAKLLSDDPNLLLGDIAQRLGCHQNVVTWAIAYWYQSRGLSVPDGRTRRKQLERKCARPYQRRGPADRTETPPA